MKDIVYVVDTSYGDWEGLYVDGVLVTEAHSLSGRELLDALGIEYQQLDVPMRDLNIGRLPHKVEDLEVEEQ